MPTSSMQELLIDQLRDLYDAEKQLTKALPKMAKAASDSELAQGFKEHLGQTQGQARRIEQMFELLGVKAKSKPCEAMKGLIQEGQEVIAEDLQEPLNDVALVAAGRRVEHYEMAAYDTLVTVAQALKKPDLVRLLQETLKEETETDKKLVVIGKRLVKEAGKTPPAEESSSRSSGGSSKGSSSKSSSAGSSATASNKASSKSASKTASAGKSSSRSSSSKSTSAGEGHVSHTTSDHDEIRNWAEQRGGKPACVRGTGGKGDIGLMRIEFPGKPNANDDKLEEISWDEFFEKFDERALAVVYQEHTAEGKVSNFNKIITRENEPASKSRTAR